MIAFDYLLQGADRLPVRLESRSAFSMYWPPEALHDPRFQKVTKAFAETDCGVTVTGTSGALKSLKGLATSARG